jgi:DNA-binding transcriptional MerR regulator
MSILSKLPALDTFGTYNLPLKNETPVLSRILTHEELRKCGFQLRQIKKRLQLKSFNSDKAIYNFRFSPQIWAEIEVYFHNAEAQLKNFQSSKFYVRLIGTNWTEDSMKKQITKMVRARLS